MIIRTVKNRDNPYYLKNRTAPNDPRLTWKAKGVHDYLMSKPDHWEAVIKELVTASADGEATVRSAINELIEFGYMHRAREINDLGRVIRWRLDAYEAPEMNPYFVANEPHCTFPHVGEPHVACPHVENQALVSNDPVVSNEQLVNNEDLEKREDPSIQDLPSPTVAAFPPSPKAMIVNQVLGNQPSGKVESGFVGLAQAATDKFNGNGKKPAEVHHLDGLTKQVESWGMTMPAFREMVDAFLDRYGMVEIANLDTELGIKTLTKAQSKVKEICAHGEQFRTVAGLSGAFSDWYATDWRGKKGEKPTGDQLVEHIGVMKSRKSMPSQSTSEAAKKEDTAFWSGELVDIGLKYPYVERKIKLGTGCSSTKDGHWIEPVYEDEEPAVEPQKAA